MHTGKESLYQLYKIESYQRSRTFLQCSRHSNDYRPGCYRFSIQGTDGTAWRTFLRDYWQYGVYEKNLFVPDWCQANLPLQRFYDDSRDEKTLKYYGQPSAPYWNGYTCNDHRPIYLSIPHSWEYSPGYTYRPQINSETNKDYLTWYEIDKETGYTYEYENKLQYNGYVQHNKLFSATKNLTEKWVPIAWKEEKYRMGPHQFREAIERLSTTVKVVRVACSLGVPIGLMVLGSILIGIFCLRWLVYFVKHCRKCCQDIKQPKTGNSRMRAAAKSFSSGCGQLKMAGKQFISAFKKEEDTEDVESLIAVTEDNVETKDDVSRLTTVVEENVKTKEDVSLVA